jgi:hypothetical protein
MWKARGLLARPGRCPPPHVLNPSDRSPSRRWHADGSECSARQKRRRRQDKVGPVATLPAPARLLELDAGPLLRALRARAATPVRVTALRVRDADDIDASAASPAASTAATGAAVAMISPASESRVRDARLCAASAGDTPSAVAAALRLGRHKMLAAAAAASARAAAILAVAAAASAATAAADTLASAATDAFAAAATSRVTANTSSSSSSSACRVGKAGGPWPACELAGPLGGLGAGSRHFARRRHPGREPAPHLRREPAQALLAAPRRRQPPQRHPPVGGRVGQQLRAGPQVAQRPLQRGRPAGGLGGFAARVVLGGGEGPAEGDALPAAAVDK